MGAALFLALSLAVLSAPGTASAAPGDVGYLGPSWSGAGSTPTGSKPESKLWWNDGFWWASMWDTASADFHIFRLDAGSQAWVDTGVPLDNRPSTRADTLWDGTHLYVASHRFSQSPATGYPSRLYRFSYSASTDTYTRDQGFPATINNFRTETLVIDKDSTGTLWATWTQGNRVWVNRTLAGDGNWGPAFVLPGGTGLSSDDVSSLVSFGGNNIGLMWSNQPTSQMQFAVHVDGQADTAWSVETALQGTGLADDHINLKKDASGRVFAATKTSKTGSSNPLNMLLVRAPSGGWSSAVYGTVANHHTRPIVLVDEEQGILHMYATAPESGGTIYEKTTPVSSIAFAPGLGTPFIRDNAALRMNNATSTKQNVNSTTDLVVQASNSTTRRYWHNYQDLGGPPPP